MLCVCQNRANKLRVYIAAPSFKCASAAACVICQCSQSVQKEKTELQNCGIECAQKLEHCALVDRLDSLNTSVILYTRPPRALRLADRGSACASWRMREINERQVQMRCERALSSADQRPLCARAAQFAVCARRLTSVVSRARDGSQWRRRHSGSAVRASILYGEQAYSTGQR